MAISTNQITVAVSGTQVQFTTITGNNFLITGHPDNTGTVYIGDSTVSVTTGLALGKGVGVVIPTVSLDEVWADADTNGDKLTWLKLN